MAEAWMPTCVGMTVLGQGWMPTCVGMTVLGQGWMPTCVGMTVLGQAWMPADALVGVDADLRRHDGAWAGRSVSTAVRNQWVG